MKRNVILKKSLALLLSVLVAVSAFASLSLLTSAAASADDLSATFDFENGDASAWVQVGAKTGAETAEGYETWNYNPTVGEAYGLEKKTIDVRQINFATGANIEKTSSNALLVGPYLNKNQADYTVLNNAPAAGAYENQAGLTSIVALAQTVDNGVAKDGLVKKSVSGRFALSDEESNAGSSVAYHQFGKDAGYSSPILVYYYKDADNWRGVRVTAGYWNTFKDFDMLRYQVIICEDGYSYRTALVSGNQSYTAGFFSTLAPDYVNQFTLGVEYASQKEAIATSTGSIEGLFPVLPGIRNTNIKNNFKAGEWLNFNFDYEPSGVQFTISDATGYKRTVLIANETTCKAYDESGASKAISKIDVSKGSFGVGATYSIGTNSYGSTEQTKFAFDDIKVNMYSTNPADNSGINAVSKLIAGITDEQSFETAKQAFEALTAEQKARVSNRLEYYKFQQRFNEKRVAFDFSEDWQKDIIAAQQGVGDGNVVNTAQYAYWKEIFQDKSGQNLLKLCNGYNEANRVQSFFVNLTDEELADVESVTLSVKGGFKAKNDDIVTAWLDSNLASGGASNACPRLVLLNATTGVPGNTNADRLRTYRDPATGAFNQSSTWSVAATYPVTVDLMQDFDIILRPNAKNPNQTDLIYQGYRTELNADTGMYEATNVYGPTINAKGAETFLTIDRKINKISFAYGAKLEWNLSGVDVKYVGWEKCVKLTAEEEALRDRIAAIGEVTVTNYATKSTTVAGIRSDYDKLNSANLADAIPEGFTDPCKTILANAEAAIANYTGYVKDAQDFVDTYETAINYTVPDITNITIAQAVVNAKLAYDTLSDGVKSVLNNNYSLVGYSFAVGTTLVDTLYPVAIALIPTQNQIDFETYYNDNSLAAATSATVDLAKLDTALTKYYAIEEEHKVAVVTQYNHMIEMLDGLFVVDGGKQFTYDAAKYAQYTNIYNYFKDTMLKVAENGNTNNNKVVNSAKYDATKATTMTLAYDYGTLNASNNGYVTYDLFNIFPKINKIDSLKNNVPSNCLFQYSVCANKPTVYVDGVNVASSTNKKNVIVPMYCNKYSGDVDYNNAQFYGRARSGSALSTGEVDGTYTGAASKYVNALDAHPGAAAGLAGYYQANFDRLCVMMEYETVYDPQFTSPYDSGTYKRTGIRINELLFWYEDSSKDGTEGNTPYVLDATKDGSWTLDNGTSDFLIRYSTLTTEIGIIYTESEVILPQLYIGDTAISHLQYVKLTREATLAEKYEQVLAKAAAGTITDADINDVLALYNDYNNLSATNKALLGTQALENCEKAFKFIRPNNNGATISLGQTTSLGFACKRPTSSKYYKFGVVIASYNAMVDNNVTVLEKDVKGSQFYEKLYTDLDAKGDELIFNIFGLFGDNSAEHWSKWIVARFYSVYKDSNGNDVVVYNSEAYVDGDGNNNNPTDADKIDTSNVIVRSINGVIKGAASKLYSYKDNTTLNVMNGASYVDATGATLTNYNTTTLATALASTTNGMLGTAADTLYLLKAYKDVFTAALAD